MKQDFEIKDNEVVIKKDEEPVNDDLMKAAIQAHTELEEGKGLSFINIFIAGANWQKEQMIEKACEWLKLHTFIFESIEEIDLFHQLFRKAMEE